MLRPLNTWGLILACLIFFCGHLECVVLLNDHAVWTCPRIFNGQCHNHSHITTIASGCAADEVGKYGILCAFHLSQAMKLILVLIIKVYLNASIFHIVMEALFRVISLWL